MEKIKCPYIVKKKIPNNGEIKLDVQPCDNKATILVINYLQKVIAQIYEYEIRYCSNGDIILYLPIRAFANYNAIIKYNREVDANVDYPTGDKNLYYIYFSEQIKS